MSLEMWITTLILVGVFGFLIKSKVPPVAIFVGALALTITFRLVPLEESLKGFSNQGVWTIAALLMVAAGMYRTGAITLITEKLIGQPKNLIAAQMKILPPVELGSAFLNNTPLVEMFVPVIRALSRTFRLAATRLYIPLSYASILGGTCTLIGCATNLVVAGMVIDLLSKNDPNTPPLREIGMFDLTYVGLPATIAGIAFLMLTSRFLLPAPQKTEEVGDSERLYGSEFRVPLESSSIGKNLGQLGYLKPVGFELVKLKRQDGTEAKMEAGTRLKAKDVLVFSSNLESLPDIWDTSGLEPVYGVHVTELESERFTRRLVQATVSRRAPAIGRKISELPPPESSVKAPIVAVSRYGKPPHGPLSDVRLEAGDIVVLEVDETFFNENLKEEAFSMTRRLSGARVKRYDRALAAALITVAMVVVVALGWMSMLNAALLATGGMLLTGCLTFQNAGSSIAFANLVIIASAIGLEAAVTGSGLSGKIADLMALIGGKNHYIALTVVFLGCILMDTMITNVASAVFMFPIAMAMASDLGVNGMPFAITVMVGASCSFISPMGYQTNLMVYGPGGYKFTDFVKIGVPMTIVVGIVILVLIPMVWPF
jgi:di/tricarboxylate transporter